MNITYSKVGDYLLPNLTIENTEYHNLGKYGLLKLNYLKKEQKDLYTVLLMKNQLNEYLYRIENEATEKIEYLVQQLTQQEGITEELKEQNQMLWIQKMNNIRNCAEEIILSELIYHK